MAKCTPIRMFCWVNKLFNYGQNTKHFTIQSSCFSIFSGSITVFCMLCYVSPGLSHVFSVCSQHFLRIFSRLPKGRVPVALAGLAVADPRPSGEEGRQGAVSQGHVLNGNFHVDMGIHNTRRPHSPCPEWENNGKYVTGDAMWMGILRFFLHFPFGSTGIP